jgi:hypothetical protein
MTRRFTKWAKWVNRNDLRSINLPGVYAIALSTKDISETNFSWRPDVIYIGMTNAKGGLKSRLQQFDNTIKGKDGHGGAHRVRHKHHNYSRLAPRLYVSISPRQCNVISNKSSDLRIMGEVVKDEYVCFAIFAERFDRLPEFNDKKRSPKD